MVKCKCGEELILDYNGCCKECGISKVELDKERDTVLNDMRAALKREAKRLGYEI